MATVTLTDVRLFSGGYEISSDHNQLTLNLARVLNKATVFGQKSNTYRYGIMSMDYSLAGYFDADGTSAIDDIHEAQWAADVSNVLTIVEPDGAAGAQAYSFEAIDSALSPFGGNIGGMTIFGVSGKGTGDALRGTLVEDATTVRSTSSNSSAYQLGAVTAGESVRAALHIVAITGAPTLDVTIQSDSVSAMTSPTTVITFPQASSLGDSFLNDTIGRASRRERV